jgi:hypothetical protein
LLPLAPPQDETDRDVREKEEQDITALYKNDPVEVHQVYLVLRQAEQRSIESIDQIASNEINSEPKQQEQITEHETTNQNFRQCVEKLVQIRGFWHGAPARLL